MAKKQEWDIYRLANRAIDLGRVDAPGEKKALKVAMENFQVRNVVQQKRFVARKAN